MSESVDTSYRRLAAGYLRKQAKQLARQLDGIRAAEDIEFVHRARVASRRLRAAMEMFRDCFDARQLKPWRKQIRRVTAELGNARDKDVQVKFLYGILESLDQKAAYPGIVRLLTSLERKRERLQANVVNAVDRLRASGVPAQIQTVAKEIIAGAKAEEPGEPSPFVFRQTGQQILDRLGETLAYQDCLDDPNDMKRHHAMRIAAKRLRYTVEISKDVYDGRLDETVTVVRKLQSYLGEVHDCDVWLDDLERFAKKQRQRIVKRFGHARPFASLETGMTYLRQQRGERRRQVFQEFVEYWQELNRRQFWSQLIDMVEQRQRPPELPEKSTEGRLDCGRVPARPGGSANGPVVSNVAAWTVRQKAHERNPAR
ncbi:MAG: hypothetical protein A2V70_08620 [Planctomycetes bacterium RBG_13_63_9]|nr:MAG: hypothetical protein A2V70_08620 [Planctomycetes bacterium RBG_13_63_9]